MSDIKVGDRVTWGNHRVWTWETEPTVWEVEEIDTANKRARIYSKGTSRLPLIRELTRLTDSDLVAAVRAMPLDDTVREEAIAGLRVPTTFEALTDDYAEVMAMMNNANSLGVIEL
jgi:hypothetical protein